jgi:hypothetical protein
MRHMHMQARGQGQRSAVQQPQQPTPADSTPRPPPVVISYIAGRTAAPSILTRATPTTGSRRHPRIRKTTRVICLHSSATHLFYRLPVQAQRPLGRGANKVWTEKPCGTRQPLCTSSTVVLKQWPRRIDTRPPFRLSHHSLPSPICHRSPPYRLFRREWPVPRCPQSPLCRKLALMSAAGVWEPHPPTGTQRVQPPGPRAISRVRTFTTSHRPTRLRWRQWDGMCRANRATPGQRATLNNHLKRAWCHLARPRPRLEGHL